MADTPAGETGAVYLFSSADGWSEGVWLEAEDSEAGDRFGFSVAIDEEVIVVGAPLHPGSLGFGVIGAAYLFRPDLRGPGRWGVLRKLEPTNEARGGRFGRTRRPAPGSGSIEPSTEPSFGVSVDVSAVSGRAIVGAPGDSGNGLYSGAAFILGRNAGGFENWGQVAEITASGDGDDGDLFGSAVALALRPGL